MMIISKNVLHNQFKRGKYLSLYFLNLQKIYCQIKCPSVKIRVTINQSLLFLVSILNGFSQRRKLQFLIKYFECIFIQYIQKKTKLQLTTHFYSSCILCQMESTFSRLQQTKNLKVDCGTAVAMDVLHVPFDFFVQLRYTINIQGQYKNIQSHESISRDQSTNNLRLSL